MYVHRVPGEICTLSEAHTERGIEIGMFGNSPSAPQTFIPFELKPVLKTVSVLLSESETLMGYDSPQ